MLSLCTQLTNAPSIISFSKVYSLKLFKICVAPIIPKKTNIKHLCFFVRISAMWAPQSAGPEMGRKHIRTCLSNSWIKGVWCAKCLANCHGCHFQKCTFTESKCTHPHTHTQSVRFSHFHTNTAIHLQIIGLFTQCHTSPSHEGPTSKTNTHDIPPGLWGY